MKFALFYEIPVREARGTPGQRAPGLQEHDRAGGARRRRSGFHSFWTVEHHFLEEYSHCSNPEILYGAIAARTREHPHRLRRAPAAEAVQPPDPHRGVGGRARPALRRAGRVRHRPLVDARRARGLRHRPAARRARCGGGARATSSARGRTTSTRPTASYWKMGAPRRVQPKPLQEPHPPIWGATSSPDGHREIGRHGIGLCSFTVGVPPEELAERIADVPRGPGRVRRTRSASSSTTRPPRSRWCTAPTPTRRPTPTPRSRSSGTSDGGAATSPRSPSWHARAEGPRHLPATRATCAARAATGQLDQLDFDYLHDSGSAVVGDPDACIEIAKRYEAAGCDLLLCLVNPYKIPHEKVMRSIELFGEHVIPAFS